MIVMSSPVWTSRELAADPHQVADKAKRVERMFAAIAPSYDLNNRLHSLWRDQVWRRAAVKAANLDGQEVVLDVACGTGDLSMAFAGGGARRVAGIDFTFDMLRLARRKALEGGAPRPTYHTGDAMRLPVGDESVDVVSIAFGIRNVVDPLMAIRQFHRVLRPAGRLVILEFALPANRLLRSLYGFYFTRIMPLTASWIARDRSGAYRYLPRSVNTFMDREAILRAMADAGFVRTTVQPLTCGIAVIYCGVKGEPPQS